MAEFSRTEEAGRGRRSRCDKSTRPRCRASPCAISCVWICARCDFSLGCLLIASTRPPARARLAVQDDPEGTVTPEGGPGASASSTSTAANRPRPQRCGHRRRAADRRLHPDRLRGRPGLGDRSGLGGCRGLRRAASGGLWAPGDLPPAPRAICGSQGALADRRGPLSGLRRGLHDLLLPRLPNAVLPGAVVSRAAQAERAWRVKR